jgi:hypothetical protein
MSNDAKAVFGLMMFLCVVSSAFCLCVGTDMDNKWWQAECVKRGHAEYNATTGKWQWKDPQR